MSVSEKAASSEEAIQKLRETEEMLQKKSDFLEKKIENELATAKKNGIKNKRGTILVIYWLLYFFTLQCPKYQ